MTDRSIKLFVFLLSVILLCLALAIAFPAAAEVGSDYEYEIEDGSAIITKYNGAQAEVIIPSSFNGCPVTVIGPDVFNGNRTLTAVTIPDGVTKIDGFAFAFSALTKVTIPNGVMEIGNGAFNCCYDLAAADLPESLETLGYSAFRDCHQLVDITIPAGVKTIDDSVFANCYRLKSIGVSADNASFISVDGVLYSKDKTVLVAYPIGKEGDRYSILEGIKSIKGGTFFESSLSEITIPDGVESIRSETFWGCSFLRRIDLPASVTTLRNCAGLTGGCEMLEGIHVAAGNPAYASVDGVLFDKATTMLLKYPEARKADSFIVPSGVKTIEYEAVFNSRGLKSIQLPDGLEAIKDSAFELSGLEAITLPSSVTSIEDSVFSGCESLSSVTLSSNLTSIGRNAFTYCISLESVTIPGCVTSIGSKAFEYCSSLASITIPPTVTSIGEEAFKDCPKLTILGEPGSFAQTYATQNAIPFAAVPGNLPSGT